MYENHYDAALRRAAIEAALRAAIEAEQACASADAAALRLHKRLGEQWSEALAFSLRRSRALCGAAVGTLLVASLDSAGIEVKGVVVSKPATPPKS